MKITKLKIEGACLVMNDPFTDSRGTFDNNWESKDFQAGGIEFTPQNLAHSINTQQHTLRGLHYQTEQYAQVKLVSCVQGILYDVIVDMRKTSPTYLRWESVQLHGGSGQSVFIPAGCAHGFLTLKQHTIVSYLISGQYEPSAQGVVRWNDRSIDIKWPVADPVISEKDKNAPLLSI